MRVSVTTEVVQQEERLRDIEERLNDVGTW